MASHLRAGLSRNIAGCQAGVTARPPISRDLIFSQRLINYLCYPLAGNLLYIHSDSLIPLISPFTF
jgi:hypothetical protein